MSGLVSAANLGGVADPRLGTEADDLGTDENQTTRNLSVSHNIPPPDLHGHNTVYLDSSISFETYRFWADRSREYEKHIDTSDAGFAQIGKLLVGRRIKAPPAPIPNIDEAAGEKSEEDKNSRDEKSLANNHGTDTIKVDGTTDKYGIPLADWEQAQRATRTATWGMYSGQCDPFTKITYRLRDAVHVVFITRCAS